MKVLKPLSISFEFFPPKSQEGITHLMETASVLSEYNPQFFSVTFGAGGSTRVGTIDTVSLLKAKTTSQIAPHLTCIGTTREDILEILHQYQLLGVRRLVALRGDLPSTLEHTGDLRYASELVEFIREATGHYFHIEVAAYPEIHPQAMNAADDILNLKRKFEAGADSALTQYFFNPDAYFYYLDECAKHGIDLPIVPGIMPITQFNKLVRFSELCGAEIPRWISKRLESYGDDLESVKQFGLEVVYHLCDILIAGGAPGLHFYTLNKAETCAELLHLIHRDIYHQQEERAVS
ncbi:MAG: methylenetetrahydrofolate reductase [NAD(P)H] [Gammaproteobacteria bacterium]|nr:methylenetetrahydrofolate reductase [NAD(P)H] [Gammaproteobacteria bacterium]